MGLPELAIGTRVVFTPVGFSTFVALPAAQSTHATAISEPQLQLCRVGNST